MMDRADVEVIAARIVGLWGRCSPWSDDKAIPWIGREFAGKTPQQISAAIDEWSNSDEGARPPKPAQLLALMRTGRSGGQRPGRPSPEQCPGHVWGILWEYEKDGAMVRDAICAKCLLERIAVPASRLLTQTEIDAAKARTEEDRRLA